MFVSAATPVEEVTDSGNAEEDITLGRGLPTAPLEAVVIAVLPSARPVAAVVGGLRGWDTGAGLRRSIDQGTMLRGHSLVKAARSSRVGANVSCT